MKKSYYAIIPANVRYHENLTPNAKLLYGEITALCNEKGFCWASNEYFANLYNVSKRSISTWIGLLEKEGFISLQYDIEANSKNVNVRKITLENNFVGGGKKVRGGIEENFEYIYNINNNINNTKEYSVKSKQEKKFSDFPQQVQKAFSPIIELFPESSRPKTKAQKRQWADCIDKLERLDGYDPRKVYLIAKRARLDDFWSDNFLSILKLRKTDKNGVKFITRFEQKFGKDIDF